MSLRAHTYYRASDGVFGLTPAMTCWPMGGGYYLLLVVPNTPLSEAELQTHCYTDKKGVQRPVLATTVIGIGTPAGWVIEWDESTDRPIVIPDNATPQPGAEGSFVMPLFSSWAQAQESLRVSWRYAVYRYFFGYTPPGGSCVPLRDVGRAFYKGRIGYRDKTVFGNDIVMEQGRLTLVGLPPYSQLTPSLDAGSWRPGWMISLGRSYVLRQVFYNRTFGWTGDTTPFVDSTGVVRMPLYAWSDKSALVLDANDYGADAPWGPLVVAGAGGKRRFTQPVGVGLGGPIASALRQLYAKGTIPAVYPDPPSTVGTVANEGDTIYMGGLPKPLFTPDYNWGSSAGTFPVAGITQIAFRRFWNHNEGDYPVTASQVLLYANVATRKDYRDGDPTWNDADHPSAGRAWGGIMDGDNTLFGVPYESAPVGGDALWGTPMRIVRGGKAYYRTVVQLMTANPNARDVMTQSLEAMLPKVDALLLPGGETAPPVTWKAYTRNEAPALNTPLWVTYAGPFKITDFPRWVDPSSVPDDTDASLFTTDYGFWVHQGPAAAGKDTQWVSGPALFPAPGAPPPPSLDVLRMVPAWFNGTPYQVGDIQTGSAGDLRGTVAVAPHDVPGTDRGACTADRRAKRYNMVPVSGEAECKARAGEGCIAVKDGLGTTYVVPALVDAPECARVGGPPVVPLVACGVLLIALVVTLARRPRST